MAIMILKLISYNKDVSGQEGKEQEGYCFF